LPPHCVAITLPRRYGPSVALTAIWFMPDLLAASCAAEADGTQGRESMEVSV
jgi:hypothetical protein